VRFSTTAGELRDALVTARHAVPSSASIIAYSGVLFMLKNGQLAVIGSDGEVTISALLKVTDASDGQVLMQPKPLAGYLQKLAANTPIQVAVGAADVEVQAGDHAPYRFRPLATTFPAPLPLKAAPATATLDRLAAAVSAVRASVPRENPGVQLVSGPDGLYLHATDQYRLSRAHLPEAGFGTFTGVVPLAVLDRVGAADITHVSVDQRSRSLRFSGPQVVVTTRLVSTTFPAVEAVLETVPASRVTFGTVDLQQALGRLAPVAEGEPLRCSIEQDTLLLSVRNADLGSGEEIVRLDTASTTKFEFAVRLEYLADAVAGHAGDTATLAWSMPDKPLFLLSSDPLTVITMVMPVKI
jgi:DNA polymerase III sliding clamp (beta) subunit (PCNA family)